MTVAATGINEKAAKQAGISYDKVILFPGQPCRLLSGRQDHDDEGAFEKDTYRLLGAQIVGFEGVDKRIDVLATAIRAGMSALALTELELVMRRPIPRQRIR